LQYIDLLDSNSNPLVGGNITSNSEGLIGFFGPDDNPEIAEGWLDAGFGSRQRIIASDIAQFGAPRLMLIDDTLSLPSGTPAGVIVITRGA
jgi:hypothetical protein